MNCKIWTKFTKNKLKTKKFCHKKFDIFAYLRIYTFDNFKMRHFHCGQLQCCKEKMGINLNNFGAIQDCNINRFIANGQIN